MGEGITGGGGGFRDGLCARLFMWPFQPHAGYNYVKFIASSASQTLQLVCSKSVWESVSVHINIYLCVAGVSMCVCMYEHTHTQIQAKCIFIYYNQNRQTYKRKNIKEVLKLIFYGTERRKKEVERQKTAQKLKKGAKKKIVGALNNKKS